jgi:hypothetical protein
MAKGLPKSIIKKYGITKKAWSVFRGRKGKTRSRKTRASNPRKVKRRMARKKKRRGGKSLQTQVFKWLRIGALAAPGAVVALSPGTPGGKFNAAMELYTGVNIQESKDTGTCAFHAEKLAAGWMPFLMTTLVTYGIPKLAGIIRRI